MSEKSASRLVGVLLATLVAFGCGASDSTTQPTPSAVAAASADDGVASTLDMAPARGNVPLAFHIDSINREGMPIHLVVAGTLTFGGRRAGSGVLIIEEAPAFDALGVGHSYSLVKTF